MAEATTSQRVYRCRVDGFGFVDKAAAVAHLRLSHSIEQFDPFIMAELEFAHQELSS
jgi:hypothetical protein